MSVRVEHDGDITTVLLSRPERKNAVDGATADALAVAFRAFDADPKAKVAVFHGEGGVFCAGADLKAVGTETQNHLSEDGDGPMGPSRLLLSKPVIASIAGHAVAGGLELALWCDLRVAEEDAVLGVFCRRWGVPLIDGGTVRLPRLIGTSRALDLILTGRAVSAAEALGMGLVNRVVKKGGAREAATALARELAAFPQACMNADRLSAIRQEGLSLEAALLQEFNGGLAALHAEGAAGAQRFAGGKGRHGRFDDHQGETMTERVDKGWQDKGLAAYPVEALVGTLGHYGIAIDEAAFKALAKAHFPLAIGAQWSRAWKGTGKFKDFPFPAADELWRRWLKEALAPNELVMDLMLLLVALGRIQAVGGSPGAKGGVPEAFAAVEAKVKRLPPEPEPRERFMDEVLEALRPFMSAIDTTAEALAKLGEGEAAMWFVELEEKLFPARAGVSRLLVESVLSKAPDTASRLEALANDGARDARARAAAIDALLHLAEAQKASGPLFKLMDEAVANHDHDLANTALERLRVLLKALPESSLKDEATARARMFVAAFDHHH